VHYTPRGGVSNEVARAEVVINCIGPESDYGRIDQTLVRNLRHRGLIRRKRPVTTLLQPRW